jgi:hypothetical protein
MDYLKTERKSQKQGKGHQGFEEKNLMSVSHKVMMLVHITKQGKKRYRFYLKIYKVLHEC